MESSTTGGDDMSKKKSIVVVDMLEEFINRDVLKKHFEQYGTVERLACSVSKKYAVIHFSTVEEADYALKNGKVIRAGAPPLRIFKSAKAAPTASQAQGQSSSASATAPATRVVTRRKISRTFSTSPPSELPLHVASSNVDVKRSEVASSSQHGPLKSSLKVSRPSPFLRKRPSFGDKAGKSGTSPTVTTRNPFSLPPRNMMSLDRRKEKTSPGGAATSSASDRGLKASTSTQKALTTESLEIDSSTVNPPPEREQVPSAVHHGAVSVLEENVPAVVVAKLDRAGSSTQQPPPLLDTEDMPVSLPLDADENTVDVTDMLGRDSLAAYTNANDNDEYDLEDRDTGTQDTAEATTEEEEEEEEEGEILDDEQNDGDPDGDEENDDDDDDDDVYESPMKRFEMEAKKSKADTGGEFSFKLSKENNSSSGSLFKLPFTSPFSLGDAPKPFSSASFGDAPKPFSSTSFGNSKPFSSTTFGDASKPLTSTTAFGDASKPLTSTTFGAAPKPFTAASFGIKVTVPNNTKASTSSSTSFVTSPAVEKVELPKERQKEKSLSTQGFLRRTETSELEKAKPSAPSGIFSSVPGSSSSKPVAITNVDSKPSIFLAKPTSISQISSSAALVSKRAAGIGSSSAAVPASSLQSLPSTSQVQKDVPNPLLLTFNPDTPEAQKLFSERAITVEERYRMLEARDKIIRARVPKTKVNVEEATRLIGTCPDMCPEKERYMRQFQRQLVGYETLPGPDFSVDHQRAIKVYSRSSADQEEPLPHELRPGPTLDFTMNYLLQMIVPLGDNNEENLSDWYHFLWDRTRSIRKDITQQQIIDLTAVSLYEKCARFHIHCGSRLCELDVHSFDPKLNDENLMKCLQSLEHLYEDLRRRQVTCPNEPEFRAYQIMMNLNEGDALYNAQQLPGWILNSANVQVALKLHHSIYTKNFVAFFKTVESLPYMTSCILHRYFFQVRSLALRCLMKAHCTLPKYETAMPMSTLQRMLGYGSEEAQYFNYLCEAHGIHCDIDENKVILKRKMFYLSEFPSIYRENHLIDSKLQTSVPEAVNGGPLPNIDFRSRSPQSSFNENGQLIPGDIVGSTSGSRSGTHVIPISINQPLEVPSFNRLQTPIQPLMKSSTFSFARVFPAKKEQPLPVQVAAVKPDKEIDAACQAATSRLIDESIKQDVAEMSEARLAEAKKQQEIATRKKLREDIVTRVAQEFLEKTINKHIEYEVRSQSISRIRQLVAIKEASKDALEYLMEDTVLMNTSIAARTELVIAKELHHRQLRMLEEIFARVRARFAVERWLTYTKKKRQERELQQEKRREELWNFPAINSYTYTTKDVYNAFCGRSTVQPSINKADSFVTVEELLRTSLEKSPNSFTNTKAKRKSDGDSDPSFSIPAKFPKLSPEPNTISVKRLRELWEFPSIDSYSRNNRQVLEAFCGSSVSKNTIIASPMSSFTPLRKDFKLPNYGFTNFNKTPGSPFFRPIGSASSDGRLSDEIRNKVAGGTTDMLKSVQNFLSEVREETQMFDNLEPYQKSVDDMIKSCPLICAPIETATVQNGNSFSSGFNEFNNSEWMEIDNIPVNIGATLNNDELLCCIQRFVHQIREEKEKSWNVDTFLNDIEI